MTTMTLFTECSTGSTLYEARLGGWGCKIEGCFGTAVLAQDVGIEVRWEFSARAVSKLH